MASRVSTAVPNKIELNHFQDDNIIKHASRQIKTETQILKRELDKELSSKVNKRLKSNEQKLNNIRTALKDLETDNEYVSCGAELWDHYKPLQLYTDGNSRLAELERALDELQCLITQMTEIRSSGTEVTRQCKEIQDKIEITSTKISSSMTSLNELINNKHNDSKLIAKVDHFELPTSKPLFSRI